MLTVRNLVEQGYTGQTWGKRRFGLCLVRQTDALPVGVRVSLVRHVAHVLDALLLLAGWFRPLWDGRRQTFADSLTTTVVILRTGWARPGTSDGPGAAGLPPGGG